MSKFRSFMKQHWAPLLGVVGVTSVLVLTGLAVAFPPKWLDEKAGTTIQAGVLVGLAIITAVYSFHTYDLAKQTRTQARAAQEQAEAAKRQAEAAFKTLSEMRDARIASVMPIVYVERYGQEDDRANPPYPKEIRFRVRNYGVAPAFELRCEVEFPGCSYTEVKHPVLENAGKPETLPPNQKSKNGYGNRGGICRVRVHYQDVFGNRYVSERSLVQGPNDTDWSTGDDFRVNRSA